MAHIWNSKGLGREYTVLKGIEGLLNGRGKMMRIEFEMNDFSGIVFCASDQNRKGTIKQDPKHACALYII